MSNVRPIFQNGTVQSILCEASDKGFLEIMVVGKTIDGNYHLTKPKTCSCVEMVGIIEMAKQWILEQMGED